MIPTGPGRAAITAIPVAVALNDSDRAGARYFLQAARASKIGANCTGTV